MRWKSLPAMLLGATVAGHAAAAAQHVLTATEVFNRYQSAAGGETAIRAIRSRVSVGDLITPGGKARLVIIQAEPNRFLRTLESPVSGLSENGFDGRVAWSRNASGVQELSTSAMAQFVREYDLYRALHLSEFYRQTRVDTGTVNGRGQFSVQAETRDGTVETLYFDRETGLMTGWDFTIAGALVRTRLEDYRPVDGVRLPFRITRSRPDFSWTEEIREVTHNVPVDSARFRKPQM